MRKPKQNQDFAYPAAKLTGSKIGGYSLGFFSFFLMFTFPRMSKREKNEFVKRHFGTKSLFLKLPADT